MDELKVALIHDHGRRSQWFMIQERIFPRFQSTITSPKNAQEIRQNEWKISTCYRKSLFLKSTQKRGQAKFIEKTRVGTILIVLDISLVQKIYITHVSLMLTYYESKTVYTQKTTGAFNHCAKD